MDEKITKIEKNCMGTLSIDAKFKGMRKVQDFIIYPIPEGATIEKVKIQSNTRIGFINLENGIVSLCPPVQSGAYNPHIMFVKDIDVLSKSELAGLKFRLVQTADKNAGNNFIHMTTDNLGVGQVSIF